MSTYRVARTVRYRHDGGELRKVGIEHRVVDVVDHGPCLDPIDVHLEVRGRTVTARVACKRRLPAEEQCDACRPHVEVVEAHRIVVYGDQEVVSPMPVTNEPREPRRPTSDRLDRVMRRHGGRPGHGLAEPAGAA
jgi:hypothetical protein